MNRPPLAVLTELDEAIQAAPAEDVPVLLAALNTRASMLCARLMTSSLGRAPEAAPDENLTAKAAAARLGMSAAWLYKNAEKLPFMVRMGRCVRFSSRGLERWNKSRQGR